MAQQNITQTFVIEAYRSLCSYPDKIAVLSGRLQGLGIAIAQAYVMAGMKDINLIDTKEARLLNAKAYLECVAKGLHSKTRIHIHLARNMEPERIASIFFIIRATIGIPDLLLLGYGHQTIHKPVFEYGTDDITQCFTSDIEQKDTLIQNFLAPGTKRKKSLITIAVVSGTNNAGCQDSNISHFLAYAKTYSGHTWFTVHELMYDIASTYRLPGSFASGSLLYNNGKSHNL